VDPLGLGLENERRGEVIREYELGKGNTIYGRSIYLNRHFGGGRNRFSFSSMVIPILARGSSLGESNASSNDVLTLVALHARRSRSWKKIATSWSVSRQAKINAMIKFFLASLYGSPSGICDPVKITGLPRFSNMKLNALAAYAIVSVPVSTTNPSK